MTCIITEVCTYSHVCAHTHTHAHAHICTHTHTHLNEANEKKLSYVFLVCWHTHITSTSCFNFINFYFGESTL